MVKAAKKIPARMQGILWSADVKKLDLVRDRVYIIHQVLVYGSFDDIRWLIKNYSREEITEVFLEHPIKMYPKHVFYFIKNFLLDLKKADLDEDKYTTSISGPVRQRAAGSI